MLTLLFWNLNGRNRERLCAELAHAHSVSILALAECVRPATVLGALNRAGPRSAYYLMPTPNNCRVRLFARFPPSELPIEKETTHYTIHRLDHPPAAELLVVSVHQRSKQRREDREQDGDFRDLAAEIAAAEARRGHARTVLMGDLNADPFQDGIFSADGLHGVPTRVIAEGHSRVVGGKTYQLFYNPMWRFFGDGSPGPPGTYFRRRSERLCRFWHMYDQVLLHPELLPYFHDRDLEILTGHGQTPFQRPNATPDPDTASDHFPILLRLDYPGV
jgi:hypothetical protein